MPLTQTLRTTPSHSQKPITSMFLTSTWHTQNLLSHSHQYPRTRPIPVRGILRLHTIFQHLRTSTISCRRLRIHRKLTTPTTSLSRAHPYLRLRAQNPASRYISTLSFLLKRLPGCGFCPPPGSLHHLDMYYLVPVFAAGSGPGIHSKPRHFLQVQWTAHPRNGEPQAPCVQCYKAHMKQARSPVLLVREWKGHNLRPHPRMPRDPPWYIPYAPLIILTLVFQGHKRTTHSLSPTLEVMGNLYKPWRVVPICFSERTTLRSNVKDRVSLYISLGILHGTNVTFLHQQMQRLPPPLPLHQHLPILQVNTMQIYRSTSRQQGFRRIPLLYRHPSTQSCAKSQVRTRGSSQQQHFASPRLPQSPGKGKRGP